MKHNSVVILALVCAIALAIIAGAGCKPKTPTQAPIPTSAKLSAVDQVLHNLRSRVYEDTDTQAQIQTLEYLKRVDKKLDFLVKDVKDHQLTVVVP
jgi:mannose/fructose/N-acetylgalactosamine-specific phosphotransferase system component IIC